MLYLIQKRNQKPKNNFLNLITKRERKISNKNGKAKRHKKLNNNKEGSDDDIGSENNNKKYISFNDNYEEVQVIEDEESEYDEKTGEKKPKNKKIINKDGEIEEVEEIEDEEPTEYDEATGKKKPKIKKYKDKDGNIIELEVRHKKKRPVEEQLEEEEKNINYEPFSTSRILSIPSKGLDFGYELNKKGELILSQDPNKNIKFLGTKNNSVGPGQYNCDIYNKKNKEVLGSCVAVGITVDGKSPKDVQKEIDEGKYKI